MADVHLSPYEEAEREGRADQFQDFTNELYDRDPTGNAATSAGVNLYNEQTYSSLPGGYSGGSSFPSSVPRDWAEDFIKRNPGDFSRIESAYQSNNTNDPFDRQSDFYDQKTNQLSAKGQQAMKLGLGWTGISGMRGMLPTQVPGQFTDPIGSWLEQFAQQRAQERENPSPGSGQSLLEDALRDISAQFKGGGFTNNEMEVLQTQALDPIEKLRQARRQQVLQQLSARGIAPTSGVAIQMLQDVDRQFDSLRTQQQRSIAAQGAQEAQSRMLQAVQLLSGLAGTENQRLNEAFQYRTVPLNLADRAFNQASQVYNMAGNPLQMVNPLLALSQQQANRGDNWQEALGYLAAILANS